MKGSVRRVTRYVDALLRDRRPPRFEPSDEEVAAMRQATAMGSLRAGVDSPDARYVNSLRRRLTDQMEGGDLRYGTRWTRRTVLARSGAAAAAVVAAIVLDRAAGLLTAGRPQELRPDQPAWMAVGRVEDVSYTQPLRFRAGGVEGYVFLSKGELRGISAVCTHQGCLLQYQSQSMNLACPCHGATFASSGAVISHKLLSPPPPLPAIAVRQRDGMIEVRVV